MPQPAAQSVATRLRRLTTTAVSLALAGVGALAVVAVPAPASAAVGDEQIAWLEVEDGVISGGPALNSGDHGNFSGTGSYTFRETGMTSTMTVDAPVAGTYPVWIRYAAGPLSAEENVTRAMGLLTNGGARQSVSYPLTGSWESWDWSAATVTLDQGVNTLAVQCDRGVEMCRLNFDAIQVGGTAPDTCVATPPAGPGATRLFDGTIASFDQWRKAGAGGFGHQTDCTIRGFRGRGATWTTAQQSGTYTLGVDWRRTDAEAASSVYVASTSNTSADPAGGYQVRIGASDTGAISYAGTTQPADAAAVAAAVEPVGSWNHFDVQLTPKRIRVLLNGVAVNTVDRTASTSGHIGLENRAVTADVNDQVGFRDIQVVPTVVLGELAGPARRATGADGTTVNQGGESTLAHLVADSQRWATRGAGGGTARIALVSPTALQADLVPASDVTYAEAVATIADEPLVNRRLTGAQLKAVLEQQWQRAADDTVPTPAFRRLGASSGFTWTEDATRPEGDRITGMWLDGVAIVPGGTYSVTASRSLADGGDNFRAFDAGVERLPDATTRSALAAYLADASATGALGLPAAQRAVGVRVLDDAPHQAGATYAVDLSSWSYSRPSDPVDTVVDVTIGGQSAGSFPVATAAGDDPFDQRGTVAVRAVVPVGLPTGATTAVITGRTTGTTVRLPVDVVAAPTVPGPDPTPTTPVPTQPPAPGPAPAPAPAATKAGSKITVKVKPRRVVVRRTRARLVVTVTSAGPTPTGTVAAQVGGKRVEATLRRGKAVVTLPKLRKPRATRVKVTYTGDARTLSTARTFQVRAVAP